MESIQEIIKKIKILKETKKGRDIVSICLLVIVSISSFTAGRYSKPDNTKQNIAIYGVYSQNHDPVIQKSAQDVQINNVAYKQTASDLGPSQTNDALSKGNYLASSRGKKYYPVDCPASKNIKESNRIYFDRATDAEKKGYTLSSSCE